MQLRLIHTMNDSLSRAVAADCEIRKEFPHKGSGHQEEGEYRKKIFEAACAAIGLLDDPDQDLILDMIGSMSRYELDAAAVIRMYWRVQVHGTTRVVI